MRRTCLAIKVGRACRGRVVQIVLGGVLFVAVIVAGSPRAPAAGSGPRPNILFLLSDDQQPDAIGAYGHPDVKTPSIDRLVERGASFEDAYCLGSWHGAVCQPSRAMLMSGRGLYSVKADLGDQVTMPQWFGDRGYQTFGTGKWHNGARSFERSFQRAKHVMLGGMSSHLLVPLHEPDEHGELVKAVSGDRFSSELFADAAIEFLESAGDAPFFAYVAFTAPHDPRMAPNEDRAIYDPATLTLPKSFLPQHPFDNGRLVVRDEALAPWPRTPEIVREQLADYYAMITHLDRQVGRILAALEATGKADNTIVVYTADHGLAMGRHGLLGKQSVYEHSMGAPLILTGPGIEPGARYSGFAYLLDLFPTLCELTGVELPQDIDGRSLVRVLGGEQARVRDRIFLAYEDAQRAVRAARYKLIRYPLVDHTQLFDLLEDPDECVDLAGLPEHAERVTTMMGWLREEQARWSDDAPLEVERPGPLFVDLTGTKRTPDAWQPPEVVGKYFGEGSGE